MEEAQKKFEETEAALLAKGERAEESWKAERCVAQLCLLLSDVGCRRIGCGCRAWRVYDGDVLTSSTEVQYATGVSSFGR